jgi:hypothetical protein
LAVRPNQNRSASKNTGYSRKIQRYLHIKKSPIKNPAKEQGFSHLTRPSQPGALHQSQQRLWINTQEERQQRNAQQHHTPRTLRPVERGILIVPTLRVECRPGRSASK